MNITTPLSCALLTPAALMAAAEPVLSPALERDLADMEAFFNPAFLGSIQSDIGKSILKKYQDVSQEWLDVIAHYRRTGDARYASPTRRTTLLHLACIAKKPELVRQLLAEGAAPNALTYHPEMERSYDGAFTFTLCDKFYPCTPPSNKENSLRIIDLLVAAGGDAKGRQAGSALHMMPLLFSQVEGAEDIALHMLTLGTDPGRNALNKILNDKDKDGKKLDQVQLSRHRFLELATREGWARVLEHMLREGMLTNIDLHPEDETSLLCNLVAKMAESQWDADEAPLFEGRAACVALMLRHGASVHTTGALPDSKTSAADFIHSHPRLLAYLNERGISVPRTPRELGEASLAHDLRRMPVYACPPLESLTPLYEALTSLLAAEEAHTVQENVLRFMMQVDTSKTAERLMALPMWHPSPTWTEAESKLFKAVLRNRSMAAALPADWLLATAEKQEAAGFPRIAHGLIHLLAQHPQAAPMVEKLCHDARPAIAAAACTVRLRLAGLDNLPLLKQDNLCAKGSKDYEQLRRLRWAVDLLTDLNQDDETYFLDFSLMDDHTWLSLECLMKNEADILKREAMDELATFLRERGADAEADYVSELHKLYSRLHPDRVENDTLESARDFFLGLGKKRRKERFDELTRPEQVARVAFKLEALLGQHLWEIHEKNTVISSESK